MAKTKRVSCKMPEAHGDKCGSGIFYMCMGYDMCARTYIFELLTDTGDVGMENRIHVLLKKVDTEFLEANFDRLLQSLYQERKEKVGRLKNRKAALISLAAGLLIQQTIERCLGILPENLILNKTEQGKPYIPGEEGFFFNISHSGEYVAIAYGDSPVGIDLEGIREKDLKVAKRCFCEEEYLYILAGKSDEEQSRRFFEIWTMKESYLKCLGTGINVPLNSFLVNPVERRVVNFEDGEYLFKSRIYEDYIISVCLKKTAEVSWEEGVLS